MYESNLSKEGIANFHNLHQWADKQENLQWRKQEKPLDQREKHRKEGEGQIRSIKDLTDREQRAMRKIWREKTKRYRDRVRQKTIVNYPESPPPSDHEDPHFNPQILDNRASGAKRRSEKQRKRRNELENVEEVKKHLLFSEVVQNQLKENIRHTKKKNVKTLFRKVLSGRFVKKYNVLSQIDMKPMKRLPTEGRSLLDVTRRTRMNETREKIKNEFDNSRLIKHFAWQIVTENILDKKLEKSRKIRKYTKQTSYCAPKNIVMKLEANLGSFFKHEANIVHQYQTIKHLKDNLTDRDAVIHMDFSENYNTKFSTEVQTFHFGGSRTQICLHTVVVYTKAKIQCYATMSENLSHNVPVMWAHLKPIMELLPSSVENIHFLSDGPVTQYRNKDMFFYLACKLTDLYPNISEFTWNYHEAGHGKGAPDGVGGTCKRTADKLVAYGSDIPTIEAFAKAIEEHCPGIKTFVISEDDIEQQKSIIDANRLQIKPFVGTLKVHQIRGNAFLCRKVLMKRLSCFCSSMCSHFNIGEVNYQQQTCNKMSTSEIFTDSDEENNTHQSATNVYKSSSCHVDGPSFSKSTYGKYKSGDFILVKYEHKHKEFRYTSVCSSDFDEENEEIQVTLLKICDSDGLLFKLDDNDISDVKLEQVLERLPVPNIEE
ncbi:unnamed protein product [Acanthoscelides obtectus]|uniref:Uncharacterized protein n=1 Tax=Acanthoscelides obtectus TaxID=200917 RepID=A0A9P0LKZ6_ACAOB|nr:unnamed protein product [Acanthoscelides obtectus]CAK1625104.1 hypothetical protein AOBTE_LOCUS2957 [Acanthoscelides obtectus]